MIYLWQQQNWQQLLARYRNGNLPHAMLFNGVAGLGKFIFAANFAKFLLCKNNNAGNDYACETCASCKLFQANNHPDFLLVQPEEVGKAIKVEQIRQLIEDVGSTAHQGGMRVVVINAADAMNIAAANALLKTLEEPLGDVIIILVSSRPFALPITVLSRCQKIVMELPRSDLAFNWLKQECDAADIDAKMALNVAYNAPLQALSLLQDDKLSLRKKILEEVMFCLQRNKQSMNAIDFATTYVDVDSAFLLRIFFSVASDLLKLKSVVADEFITNIEHVQAMRACCKNFSAVKLMEYQSYLLELGKVIGNNIALNKQLLLENMWMRLSRCTIIAS